MKILGLDLSSKTGFAVISISGQGSVSLLDYGKIDTKNVIADSTLEEYNHIFRSRHIANKIYSIIERISPDLIVIEQTNLGKSRGSQKFLEFIHFAVLDAIEVASHAFGKDFNNKTVYVDTSAWRNTLGLKLSKDQRKKNKDLARDKKAAILAGKKTTVKRGEGKITPKHLAVEYVNNRFNLGFKLKDNDMADAICLSVYGAQKVTSTKKTISEILGDIRFYFK